MSETISENYREMNAELHGRNASYGTSGKKWAKMVKTTLRQYPDLDSVLDYGCGKQTLAKSLPNIDIRGYDPAFEELAATPEPADLVVCTDVLEHIEPDLLDNVLDDLQRVTSKLGIFVIATRPAVKTLADGRNAHLSLMPEGEWLYQLGKRFKIVFMYNHHEAPRRGGLEKLGKSLTSGSWNSAEIGKGEFLVVVAPQTSA